MNLNYGDVFGNFLTGLGKSFDGKNTSEIDADIKTKSKEEILKAVTNYKEKQEFLYFLSNGHRGKFTEYGMDLFLIGKSNKDFTVKKIIERKKELGLIKDSTRLLQENKFVIAKETGFDWSQFFAELKFYFYMASWVNKLVSRFLVWKSTKSMKITEGLVK